jgi:hypothetical protein
MVLKKVRRRTYTSHLNPVSNSSKPCLSPFFRYFTSHYFNFACRLFFFHTPHLLYEFNTLYDNPIKQPITAAVNMKAHHCKQFRVSSIQTHMYVPQDYCIVNVTTMISARVTVILPSSYVITLAWRH